MKTVEEDEKDNDCCTNEFTNCLSVASETERIISELGAGASGIIVKQ